MGWGGEETGAKKCEVVHRFCQLRRQAFDKVNEEFYHNRNYFARLVDKQTFLLPIFALASSQKLRRSTSNHL
jgi:hypothetical protein